MRLLFVVMVAGCSSSQTAALPGSDTSTPPASTATTLEPNPVDDAVLEDPDPVDDAVLEEPTESTVAPVRPYDDSPSSTVEYVSTSVWISRLEMTSTRIEMQWGTFDGASEYQLHRVPRTSDTRPIPDVMTADNLLHVADNSGQFVDDAVEENTSYWYGVRAFSAEGTPMAIGWHRADAVDDTEPPGVVEILSAELRDGEVLVTWAEPDENYELHSYRILRGVNGGELESLAVTWNMDQRSLLDDDPPRTGTVTYAVDALDFHWNRSSPEPFELAVE